MGYDIKVKEISKNFRLYSDKLSSQPWERLRLCKLKDDKEA